jgi:hypothetical protein
MSLSMASRFSSLSMGMDVRKASRSLPPYRSVSKVTEVKDASCCSMRLRSSWVFAIVMTTAGSGIRRWIRDTEWEGSFWFMGMDGMDEVEEFKG